MEFALQASILLNILILILAQNVQMPTYEETIQQCALELKGNYASLRDAISNVRPSHLSYFWLIEKSFQYPWAVSLYDTTTKEVYCSGSILSSNAVLTAAHCLSNRNDKDIKMFFGYGHSTKELGEKGFVPTEPEFIRNILFSFIHPIYRTGIAYHDVAVLTFEEPLVFNTKVRPICLPGVLPTKVTISLFIKLIFFYFVL